MNKRILLVFGCVNLIIGILTFVVFYEFGKKVFFFFPYFLSRYEVSLILYGIILVVFFTLVSAVHIIRSDINKSLMFGFSASFLHCGNAIYAINFAITEYSTFYSYNIYLAFLTVPFLILSNMILLKLVKINDNNRDITIIKNIVLDFSLKFANTGIKEIAEKTQQDRGLIIRVVKDMIENKEIHAKYFTSTKAITFYQQVNVNEIDSLMKKYRDWEEKSSEKSKSKERVH